MFQSQYRRAMVRGLGGEIVQRQIGLGGEVVQRQRKRTSLETEIHS